MGVYVFEGARVAVEIIAARVGVVSGVGVAHAASNIVNNAPTIK
jgi:hypothetical protein